MSRARRRSGADPSITAGAVPSDALEEPFPPIDLPLQPPFLPMEARLVEQIPAGDDWLYEPKWDGFRCLAFRSGDQVLLQSKSAQPLGRYFPELVEGLRRLPERRFVLDGEIVITVEGRLSFDDLLQRIHPAESRIGKLARETPATFFAFDLLMDSKGGSLVAAPLSRRRELLESFFNSVAGDGNVRLSPATRDLSLAERWMRDLSASGLDGILAKRLDARYLSGDRSGMPKSARRSSRSWSPS